jgi:KDO2-lipid IV(A) lauroyltransferase
MAKRIRKKAKSLYHPTNWPLHLGLGIVHLIALLPRPFKRGLRFILGWVLFHVPTQMRHVAQRNIAACFPELDAQAQKAMLKENFALLGALFVEGLNMPWPSKTNIFPAIGNIDGLEYVEQALARKQGVLLLFPHLIAIYLVGCLLIPRVSFPFSLMYNSPKNTVLKRFFDVNIKKYCKDVFTRKDVRPMIQHLREGNLVWYAPDLEPGKKHSIFAPFFNIPAATYTTTARIAQLSNAVTIPIAFYRRENEDVYDVIFHPPLAHFPTGNEIEDATLLNKTVEDIVRVKPAQYLWIYKRFSRRPDGSKTFYN